MQQGTAVVKKCLDAGRKLLEGLREYVDSTLAPLEARGVALAAAVPTIAASWSGSAAGYHGALYYKNFQRPPISEAFSVEWGGLRGIPDGWRSRTADEVRSEIERLAGPGTSMSDFEGAVSTARETLGSYREEFVIALAAFPFDESTGKEKSLYESIERYDFGKTKDALIRARMPGVMTRDSGAVMQGIMLPSHLYFEGVADEGVIVVKAAKDFLKLIDRFIRQVEAKMSVADEPTQSLADLHPAIQSKCGSLFEAKAYPEAVEKGFKVVRDRLRALTGYETGSEAFGKGGLYIRGAAAPNVEAGQKRRSHPSFAGGPLEVSPVPAGEPASG